MSYQLNIGARHLAIEAAGSSLFKWSRDYLDPCFSYESSVVNIIGDRFFVWQIWQSFTKLLILGWREASKSEAVEADAVTLSAGS